MVEEAAGGPDSVVVPDALPVLPLRDAVVLPLTMVPLAVGQPRSVRLVDDVMRGNRLVALVAQTDPKAEPFAAWQASAQALALGMDAVIVDDNGQPLSADGFAAIGAELGQLYHALESHGLGAGSPAARRLFS